jgi:hypothetical protein
MSGSRPTARERLPDRRASMTPFSDASRFRGAVAKVR